MKLKRGKLLVDPPSSASSDIAFILIIFFAREMLGEYLRDILHTHGEPFGNAQGIAFVLIWVALLVYTVDAVRAMGEVT